jgi:hypothetical protein
MEEVVYGLLATADVANVLLGGPEPLIARSSDARETFRTLLQWEGKQLAVDTLQLGIFLAESPLYRVYSMMVAQGLRNSSCGVGPSTR